MNLDIKIGLECNNRCIHCVVDPMRCNNTVSPVYFKDIMKQIHESNPDLVVITGGEPTIRDDLVLILQGIKSIGIPVCLQTNGTKLYEHLDDIVAESLVDWFVIAIHGPKDIHNNICNFGKEDHFSETMKSLQMIKDAGLLSTVRSETVISKYNMNNLAEIAKIIIDFGIVELGFSFPHLDGHYYSLGGEVYESIAPTYSDIVAELIKLDEIAYENKNVKIYLEKVPQCVAEFKCLQPMDNNQKINKTILKYGENEADYGFSETYDRMTRYYDFCNKCTKISRCAGVWSEYYDHYGDIGVGCKTC